MFSKIFSKFLQAMACMVLFSVANSAWAASPNQAQLDEFMRVSRIQDMFSPAMEAVEKEVRQTMGGLAQQIGMNLTQSKRFDQAVVQRLMPQIRNEMSWQKLAPLFQEAFIQTMDAQDIERVLAFHRSPSGRAYQAVAMELLKNPDFINAINNGDTHQTTLMLQPKMSVADFQALQEYNNNPSVQQVQSKLRQTLPTIIQRHVQPQLETIVQTFLEQELADFSLKK